MKKIEAFEDYRSASEILAEIVRKTKEKNQEAINKALKIIEEKG